MEDIQRHIKFKVWDVEMRLLKSPRTLHFEKGRLGSTGIIYLQFTGLYDINKVEIYEEDILLMQGQKYHVKWDESRSGWGVKPLEGNQRLEPFIKSFAAGSSRLCNHYESMAGINS